MRNINKILAIIFSIALVSCVDKDVVGIPVPEKPTGVATQEYLNSFDILKSYINHSTNSPFRLAASLSATDFAAGDLAYSTLVSNFEGVDINSSCIPVNMLGNDGAYDFNSIKSAGTAALNAGITVYGGALCSNQGQPAAYLNELIAPEIIKIEPEKGTTPICDFESDELGAHYEMTNGSSAIVEEDPDGKSGKVLHVGTDTDKAAYSYAKIKVKLPEGRKLGDYVSLTFDMRIVNEDGIYGQGMQLLIDGNQYPIGGGPATVGCKPNVWERQLQVSLNSESVEGMLGLVLPGNLKNLTEFELAIGSASSGAQYYLDNIVMTYETVVGGTVGFDFEGDAIGADYAMTNGNQAVVAEDPEGKSGHVLHVGTADNLCSYSYPKFHVQLAQGVTLADCSAISLDMYLIGGKGKYGSGMKIIINGTELDSGKGPAAFGCPDDAWGRGLINIPFLKEGETAEKGQVVIPQELSGLTEFDLAVGSGSGEWHAYIDNVNLHWTKDEDIIIEKTPEQKKEILTQELTKWINGAVEADSSIVMWDVVSEPLDNTNNENTFNWAEYLGESDYARVAVNLARTSTENELKLFVSNSFNQYDDIVSSVDRLVSLVKEWQKDNVTVIDGYNIRLQAIYSENSGELETSKTQITKMLEKLAATGKAVRLSDLGIIYEDVTGNFISTSKITSAQRERAAAYMEFIIKEYMRVIPAENQYGISLSSMTETEDDGKICPWTSGYGRTEMYEGIVNGLKVEVSDDTDNN